MAAVATLGVPVTDVRNAIAHLVPVVVLVVAATAGCGAFRSPPTSPPIEWERRAVTTGAPLLSWLPGGADMVAEVDLARARANPTIGPLVTALATRAGAQAGRRLGFDLLSDADVVVAGAYRVGTATAQVVVLVAGKGVDAPAAVAARRDATALDAHTVAFGPAELRQTTATLVGTGGAGLASDQRFLALRDVAMPRPATGATVRVTARLNDAARVTLAGKLGVDEAPRSISLWLDVADDLAAVTVLGGDDHADAVRLAAEARVLERRLARLAPMARIDLQQYETAVRVVFVLGPHRLEAWVRSMLARLEPREASGE